MKSLLSIFVFLFIFSCNQSVKNPGEEKNFKADPSVDKVNIMINHNTAIWTNPKDDSVLIFKKVREDTTYDRHHWKTTWETIKRIKSPELCDSLYMIASDIITHPVFLTGDVVTDYAGNYLSITIGNQSSEVSMNYSSVGDWKKETGKTAALYRFLKRQNLLENTEAIK